MEGSGCGGGCGGGSGSRGSPSPGVDSGPSGEWSRGLVPVVVSCGGRKEPGSWFGKGMDCGGGGGVIGIDGSDPMCAIDGGSMDD